MKIFLPSLFRSKATALLIVIGSLASTANMNAQTVFLSFSGGGAGNAPLAITWTTPITYTVTGIPSPSGAYQPWFFFKGVGNVYNNSQSSTVGSPTYTGIDGTFAVNNISSGNNFNDAAPSDVLFTGYNAGQTTLMFQGETFTLTAGTLTTGIAYTGTLPTNGLYSTYITDGSWSYLGTGSTIPEPSTYAAIAGASMLGLAVLRRRTKAA